MCTATLVSLPVVTVVALACVQGVQGYWPAWIRASLLQTELGLILLSQAPTQDIWSALMSQKRQHATPPLVTDTYWLHGNAMTLKPSA